MLRNFFSFSGIKLLKTNNYETFSHGMITQQEHIEVHNNYLNSLSIGILHMLVTCLNFNDSRLLFDMLFFFFYLRAAGSNCIVLAHRQGRPKCVILEYLCMSQNDFFYGRNISYSFKNVTT